MALTSKIVTDSPAARRFRLLAPLVVLIALAALLMMPGMLAERADEPTLGAAGPQAQGERLAPAAGPSGG